MHDTGCLGLVHWDDPEGWNGEGGGYSIVFGQIFCFSEGLLRHTDSFLAFMLIVTVLISHCLMRDTDTQRGWVT